MSFFNDIPHTRQYDGDLGWLIEAYRKLLKQYQELQERVTTLEELYNSIPDRIEAAIQEGLDKIDAALQKLNQDIENFRQEMANLQNQFRAEMEETKRQIQAAIEAQQAEFDKMKAEFDKLKADLLETYQDIYRLVDGKMLDMEIWVLGKLEQFSNSYPWYRDPSDGKTEPMQTILDHIWNRLSRGLNVWELECMHINVAELESWNINVWELEEYGKDLHWFDRWKHWMMLSPFTGQLAPIAEVVQMLANLHMDGVLVGTVEAQAFNVQSLEDKQFNVYDVSWKRGWFDEMVGGQSV